MIINIAVTTDITTAVEFTEAVFVSALIDPAWAVSVDKICFEKWISISLNVTYGGGGGQLKGR